MTDLATALRRSLDGRWAHIRDETRTEFDAERFAAAEPVAEPRGATAPGSPTRCRASPRPGTRRAGSPSRPAATATSAGR